MKNIIAIILLASILIAGIFIESNTSVRNDTVNKNLINEETTECIVSGLTYEDKRDFDYYTENLYFVDLKVKKDDSILRFRTNKDFFEKLNIGTSLSITKKNVDLLNGNKDLFYLNDEELTDAHFVKETGDVPVTLVKAETDYKCYGRYIKLIYLFTFADEKGNEKTFEVEDFLYDDYYIGDTTFVDVVQTKGSIKGTECTYYFLNGTSISESY